MKKKQGRRKKKKEEEEGERERRRKGRKESFPSWKMVRFFLETWFYLSFRYSILARACLEHGLKKRKVNELVLNLVLEKMS